jgi:hypothetical protein
MEKIHVLQKSHEYSLLLLTLLKQSYLLLGKHSLASGMDLGVFVSEDRGAANHHQTARPLFPTTNLESLWLILNFALKWRLS